MRAYGVELDHNGVGRCPFHDDAHASFQVWADGWRCYAENRGGDALHVVMDQEGMSPKEALAYVRGRFPVPGLERSAEQPRGRAERQSGVGRPDRDSRPARKKEGGTWFRCPSPLYSALSGDSLGVRPAERDSLHTPNQPQERYRPAGVPGRGDLVHEAPAVRCHRHGPEAVGRPGWLVDQLHEALGRSIEGLQHQPGLAGAQGVEHRGQHRRHHLALQQALHSRNGRRRRPA